MKLLFKRKKLKGVLATGWYILGNEVRNSKRVLPSIADTILHWYRKWSGCSGFDFLKHTFSWKLQRG
jgi:hypothetical protein